MFDFVFVFQELANLRDATPKLKTQKLKMQTRHSKMKLFSQTHDLSNPFQKFQSWLLPMPVHPRPSLSVPWTLSIEKGKIGIEGKLGQF
jgi:hypothetical protein